MINQKKTGNSVEKEFLSFMKKNGWWCTLLADKMNGQPFDCICAKNKRVIFVDVKNVNKGDKFYLSRIEDNQISAFNLLKHVGCDDCYIVCKFDDGNFYNFKFDEELFKDKTNVSKNEMNLLPNFEGINV